MQIFMERYVVRNAYGLVALERMGNGFCRFRSRYLHRLQQRQEKRLVLRNKCGFRRVVLGTKRLLIEEINGIVELEN